MSFREVMKRIGVKPSTINVLEEEEVDLNTLRRIPENQMYSALRNVGLTIPVKNTVKIKRWSKLMKKTNRASRRTRSNANINRLLETMPANNPYLFHQTSVSEDLLDELLNNNDLRLYMDELMSTRTQDLYYLDEHVHLKQYTETYLSIAGRQTITRLSRVPENRQGIYYNWCIKENEEPAFHLALHHTKDPVFRNRSGVKRMQIGALHVKMDNRYGTLRRLLINLVDGVYVISVCKGKRFGYVDQVAQRMVNALVEYYTNTGRMAKVRSHC
jgi:hypothetical protein